MQVKIVLSHPRAKVPAYETAGAGCFDIRAIVDNAHKMVSIKPGTGSTFHTGLKFEVPAGQVLLIGSRSGHGFKHDVSLANCLGYIDSDYRGELMVRLFNKSKHDHFAVHDGDRIAQGMIVPIPRIQFQVVTELSTTARGEGGFGSTGAA